jgi:putative membrane protein insertion efficiency factor
MKQVLSMILLFLIYLYQHFISPLIPARCRYTPTCSTYSKECIIKHGPFKGSLLTLKRIFKCHPWGGTGHDPIP